MAVPSALALWQENAGANYHGRDYRRMLEALMAYDVATSPGTGSGGVMRPAHLAVSQRGAGANMSVDVAVGMGYVDGSQDTTQGGYLVYNDAVTNVALDASDPTNGRYDLIGIRVRDTEYTAGSNDAAIIVVTGTPAASPAEPTPPDNFVTLARVTVGAGVTSITDANITDRRRRMAALGGVIICTAATRPSVNLWAGQIIYETDTTRVLIYDGSNWRFLGLPFATAVRSSGDITVNTAAWGNTDTGLDLTLPAVAGDLIEAIIDFAWFVTGGGTAYVDVRTVAGSSYFGTAVETASGIGIPGLIPPAVAGGPNGASSTAFRTLVSGDISAGSVVLRLRSVRTAGVNQTILAGTSGGSKLYFSARNLGYDAG